MAQLVNCTTWCIGVCLDGSLTSVTCLPCFAPVKRLPGFCFLWWPDICRQSNAVAIPHQPASSCAMSRQGTHAIRLRQLPQQPNDKEPTPSTLPFAIARANALQSSSNASCCSLHRGLQAPRWPAAPRPLHPATAATHAGPSTEAAQQRMQRRAAPPEHLGAGCDRVWAAQRTSAGDPH